MPRSVFGGGCRCMLEFAKTGPSGFFLLLDDVWSLTTLEEIGRFLPNRDNGSRIIVTTRSDLVARAIEKGKTGCVAGCVCKVDPLNYRNARQLFKKVMCTQYWNVPSRLLEICSGLPLAIVTMAGRFACDPWKSSEEWTEIYRSLTPTLGTSHTDYSLTKVLSSCYNDMPVEIKACSLYFSIFPRGQKVNRKRLTRRWISDGFVNEQQGLKAEEVAEAYLTHLVRRKVLRAVEHNSNGKVKSYQVVHDKVLENIVSRANEENFVTTIGGCGVLPSSTKVRRLSAQFNSSSKYGKELEIMNLSHVRDVTMFGSLEQLPPSLLKFKIVQVLDLEGCKGFKQQFTDEICRNSLLKYLSLRRTDIKKLTKRIGNLQFLETLDIRETDVIELPKAIYKLERLANLFGGNKKTRKALKLPKGEMRKMKSLRILTGVEIGEEKISDLNNMPTLRKLSIYKLKTDKSGYFFRFLSYAFGMTPLTSLVIHDESSEFSKALDQVAYPFESIDALEFSGKLVQLPKWITKRNTLTKLTLPVMALRADNLVILSKIDSLFTLTFSLYAAEQDAETAAIVEANKALPGGVILFPVGGFENLKLLRFSVPYLPHLSFPKGALPTLERLELRFSDGYRPDGMEELKNLREVQIRLHGETRETASSISHLVNEVHTGTRVIFD